MMTYTDSVSQGADAGLSLSAEEAIARHRDGTPPPSPTRCPRILIAEDDMEMRRLIVFALRHSGYEVVECRDGGRLVQELASTFLPAAHPRDFDLVISDIRMPGFSGLEVLDGLHDRADLPPVILITAFGDIATHARARQLGALAVLDKPFRISDLVARVHEVLEHKGAAPTEALGISVQELNVNVAEQFKYVGEVGVAVTAVRAGSAAQLAGIERGMLILEVNRQPVTSTQEFHRAVSQGTERSAILLLVRDGVNTRYVELVP